VSATDLDDLVRGQVGAAIDGAGAGGEGIGYAVTWSPMQDAGGGYRVAWMFIITAPSLLFGHPPHAAVCDPVICPSIPSQHQVDQVVRASLPPLRAARKAERDAALSDGASRSRLN
jgi:hypothetical protein